MANPFLWTAQQKNAFFAIFGHRMKHCAAFFENFIFHPKIVFNLSKVREKLFFVAKRMM